MYWVNDSTIEYYIETFYPVEILRLFYVLEYVVSKSEASGFAVHKITFTYH